MNAIMLEEMLGEMIKCERAVRSGKGVEYTKSEEDQLSNFKKEAGTLGVSPLVVWAIYYNKHHTAIMNYVKTGKTFSDETIQGRILDCRVYLWLLRGLIEDLTTAQREEPF